MKFKIGDRIEMLPNHIYDCCDVGDLATVSPIHHPSVGWLMIRFDDGQEKGMHENSEFFKLAFKTWKEKYEKRR